MNKIKPFKVFEHITACDVLHAVEFVFTGEFVHTCLAENEAKAAVNNYNQRGLKAIEELEKAGHLKEGSTSAAKYYFRNPQYWDA